MSIIRWYNQPTVEARSAPASVVIWWVIPCCGLPTADVSARDGWDCLARNLDLVARGKEVGVRRTGLAWHVTQAYCGREMVAAAAERQIARDLAAFRMGSA